MLKTRKISAVLIISILAFAVPTYAQPQTAVDTVREFYKIYLNRDLSKPADDKRPAIGLSHSFIEVVKHSSEVCEKYADGPCGWGADGDEYLDAQEWDPKLSYDNSGITIKEIKPDVVQVKLNVYPSIKDAAKYYDRTITYTMVKENGKWVVDDVTYTDGISERKRLAEESSDAIANPDPEAIRRSHAK